MREKGIGRAVMWLTIAASCAAGVAAFHPLYRLRNDPQPPLGATFRVAAFLQPVPYAAAAVLAVCLRRWPEVLGYTLAAVVGCGLSGWWWLGGLAEVRRIENEPVRRNALGNIFPDIEGLAGSVEALLWPAAVAAIVGGLTLIGWAASGRMRRRLARQTGPNGTAAS